MTWVTVSTTKYGDEAKRLSTELKLREVGNERTFSSQLQITHFSLWYPEGRTAVTITTQVLM